MSSAAADVTFDLAAPTVVVREFMTNDRAIDLYLGDLARRGAERTRTTYSRILYKFADRLPVDQDVAKNTEDDCRRYLDTMSHLARGTQIHAFRVLNSYHSWLYKNRKIARNPMDRLEAPRAIAAADLDVVTVSTDDVRRLLLHAETWAEKVALGILVYMGPRRHAVASLKLADYDRARGRLRFREKGGKIIWKPVPHALDQLLEAAVVAGIYAEQSERYGTSYLVPPEGPLQRPGNRDDRVIWRLVKKVADRAGVVTHVHALRAAFATFYLETHQGDVEALQMLMGHRNYATTQVYLRRLDKEAAMERVRDLSWGVSMTANEDPSGITQIADESLASSRVVGAGGFEPPFGDEPHG